MKYDMLIVLSLLSLVLSPALGLADGHWLCKEESSVRRDGAIYSCGVGVGSDENEARTKAFDAAKEEFAKVCSMSSDCKGHEIEVAPQRTSCEQDWKTFKCYRLIVFHIGNAIAREEPGGPQGPTDNNKVEAILTDTSDDFKPFKYEDIAKLPKVRRGMTKKDLLHTFGSPVAVDRNFEGGYQWFYHNKACLYEVSFCYVVVVNDRVSSYTDFKPAYTEELR